MAASADHTSDQLSPTAEISPASSCGVAEHVGLEHLLRRVVAETLATGFEDVQKSIRSSCDDLTTRIEVVHSMLDRQHGAPHGGAGPTPGMTLEPRLAPSPPGARPAPPPPVTRPASALKARGKPVMAWSMADGGSSSKHELSQFLGIPSKLDSGPTNSELAPSSGAAEQTRLSAAVGGKLGGTEHGDRDRSNSPPPEPRRKTFKSIATASVASMRMAAPDKKPVAGSCPSSRRTSTATKSGALSHRSSLFGNHGGGNTRSSLQCIPQNGIIVPSEPRFQERQSDESIRTATLMKECKSYQSMASTFQSPGTLDIFKIDAMHTERMLEMSLCSSFSSVSEDADSDDYGGSKVQSIKSEDSSHSESTECIDELQTSGQPALASSASRLVNMEALRDHQEREAVSQVDTVLDYQQALATGRSCIVHLPLFLLHLYGVVPWGTGCTPRWYRRIVFAVLVVLLVSYTSVVASEAEFIYMRLSSVCPLAGGMVGLLLLRHANIDGLLGPDKRLLERYARAHGFLDEWLSTSRRSFVVVFVLWLFAVVAQSLMTWSLGWNSFHSCSRSPLGHGGCTTLAFLYPAAGGGLFAALVYCQIHVCGGLELMVDKFCIRFFENPDCANAVNEWAVLQALLRRAANTVDSCILTILTSILGALLLMGAEVFVGDSQSRGSTALAAVSELSVALLALYGLFRAATVTEKCSRVPALLNSLRFKGDPINHEQQYIVQYVEHSAAGFYVKGVRLTTFMVLKMTYVAGMLAFAFVTRIGEG